jgi:hypothetical protein
MRDEQRLQEGLRLATQEHLSGIVAASWFLPSFDLGDQGVVAWVCDLRIRQSVPAPFGFRLYESIEQGRVR